MHGDRQNVLVACEQSGVVRDAFRAAGCNAWSTYKAMCAPQYERRPTRESLPPFARQWARLPTLLETP